MQCGLLGEKLSHSYSPLIHSYYGDYSYCLFDKKPEQLQEFLRSGEFDGLNVTSPHKKAVLPFCDKLSDQARLLGAVNTIVRQSDGTLIGHNTDYFGFHYLLEKSELRVAGKKVLVLGSGGASNTVFHVLTESGAMPVVISRGGENNYQNLHNHLDAAVIVNATPVGMYPNTGCSPVDIAKFPNLEGVIDLIYNPSRTQLLMDAEKRGLITHNGLWMLVAQAKESAEWFTGKTIPNEAISRVYHALKTRMENTILIGMPGSGKSTIGKILAEMTGKTFVDADTRIESLAGKSIAAIFADDGEIAFRQLETKVLTELGKQSGLVIATGGGCVLTDANYPLLHQNGTIIRLDRELSALPTEGRPLSQASSLQDMFKHRDPLYDRFADFTVSNHSSPYEAASSIIALEVTP